MRDRIAGGAKAGALALVLALAGGASSAAAEGLLQEAVEFTGTIAFIGSGAPGMIMAAVQDGETAFAGFGEIRADSGIEPDGDTMLRIGSISKTFCGEVLGSLALEGRVKLTDPVGAHLGEGFSVPEKDGRTLRLIDVITQSAGLPREVPNQTGGTPDDPFAGNTPEAQAAALAGDPFLFAPGTGVLYSNFAHDLLGAALAGAAGRPYADLLTERVLVPRGMIDTVFNLREGDSARTMQGHGFTGEPWPLVPTPVTIECSGGLYSTANDMLKWMAWHLDRDDAEDALWRRMGHAAWLYRDGLAPVTGVDDGGPMGAMGLGWVVVLPEGDRPLMLNKSGGLQGEFSYVVIAPTRGVGVFASINAFSVAGFGAMVKAANDLVAELAPR